MTMETICKGCGVTFCPLPVAGRRPRYCGPDCKLKRDGARCRDRHTTITVSGRKYDRFMAAARAQGKTLAQLVEDAIGPALGCA